MVPRNPPVARPIDLLHTPDRTGWYLLPIVSRSAPGVAIDRRLDWEDTEARIGLEPEDRLTPETLYDAQWALLLLRRATDSLRVIASDIGKFTGGLRKFLKLCDHKSMCK